MKFDNLVALYDYLDRATEEVRTEYPWHPCSKGCDGCCHYSLFLVTGYEGAYLAEGMKTLPRDTRRMVEARARERVHELYTDFGFQPWARIVERSIGRGMVCPLLEDGACLLYQYRPAICRAYGYYLFSSDAYWCEKVEGIVKEHQEAGEKLRALAWSSAEDAMRRVLWGKPRVLPAWLVE